MRPSTFWLRIFWSVVPIVVILLVIYGLITVREQQRIVTAEFMKRGEAVAAYLAASSELAVFTEDKQLLGSSIRGAVKDPDVAYVVIHGETGQPLADGGRQVGDATGTIDAALLQRVSSRNVKRSGERVIEFLAPIVSEPKEAADQLLLSARRSDAPEPAKIIGGVRVGLSLRSVEHYVSGLIKLWSGITLAFVVLSTLAVYGFSRRITRPINRLTAQAQKIAAGNLEERIPVESRDEIGQLATAFNEMTLALKGNIDVKERALGDLQELNRTLEDRVRQRTAEVQERSLELQQSLQEVRAMGEISRAVGSSLDLGEVLRTISAQAVGLSSSDACAIFEVDPLRERFIVVASSYLAPDFVTTLQETSLGPVGVRSGPISRAMESGEAVQVSDIAAAEMAFKALYLQAGFRAFLAVPMGSGNVSRAMAVYRRQPGTFDERTVELLTTVASQSKVAIENARLFKEVEDKSRQLEVASRHKSDFLANVSHELRTPMNAILGFNEMIVGGIYGDVPPDLKVPLADIQSSGKHLLRLINNVLDLSKIEAGRMELALADYSVPDIVENVRASLRSLAAEKDIEFVTAVGPDLPLAYGDGGRITQCLMNLAGNALKFTRQGRVEISADLRGDVLVYRVADTGIGIAPDKVETVFAEFRQGDATIASEFGGTGLGLSITRKFVEMHRGRIWVESELGKGSTFFFAVPLRPEGETTA